MKKQPMKFNVYLWLAVMGVILVTAVAMILVNSGEKAPAPGETTALEAESTSEAVTTQPEFPPIDLGQGILITDIASYTGAYVEDGTNEVVSGVMMLILENTSSQALQYAQVQLLFGEETALFTLTNLPAGERVVLLEQERMEYISTEPDGWLMENPAFVDAFPMHEDIFWITGAKGVLTVCNISESPVSGDVYVYYKNSSQDLYYGGITFRARVDGGLQPGEEKQVLASHYNPTASAILMVSYTP